MWQMFAFGGTALVTFGAILLWLKAGPLGALVGGAALVAGLVFCGLSWSMARQRT
jgi:hypothetical protein